MSRPKHFVQIVKTWLVKCEMMDNQEKGSPHYLCSFDMRINSKNGNQFTFFLSFFLFFFLSFFLSLSGFSVLPFYLSLLYLFLVWSHINIIPRSNWYVTRLVNSDGIVIIILNVQIKPLSHVCFIFALIDNNVHQTFSLMSNVRT